MIQKWEGVSLSLPIPDLSFFSDASDIGWGANITSQVTWSPSQVSLSINMRELMAVQNGLLALGRLLVGQSVALFCDNTTTVACLRRSGGTFSSALNSKAREVLLWAEAHQVRLLPQYIMGSSNVAADILSRPTQVIGSEWTLHQGVVDRLIHQWPAVIDLFATSMTARLPVYFSPASDPMAAGTDALLQPWNDLQAYAFPPIAIIGRVLLKLRVDSHRSVLAPEGLVPGHSRTVVRYSHRTTQTKRSAKTTTLPSFSPKSVYASADCVATIKRFARQAGFSFCSGWTTCLLSKEVHTYELSGQVRNL